MTTSFADSLRALRAKAELSQAALCEKAGKFSQPLLSKYESGKAMPSPKTAYRLAKALGVEVGELNVPAKAVAASNGHAKPVSVRKRGPGRPRGSRSGAKSVATSASNGAARAAQVTATASGVSVSGPRAAVLAAIGKLLG